MPPLGRFITDYRYAASAVNRSWSDILVQLQLANRIAVASHVKSAWVLRVPLLDTILWRTDNLNGRRQEGSADHLTPLMTSY